MCRIERLSRPSIRRKDLISRDAATATSKLEINTLLHLFRWQGSRLGSSCGPFSGSKDIAKLLTHGLSSQFLLPGISAPSQRQCATSESPSFGAAACGSAICGRCHGSCLRRVRRGIPSPIISARKSKRRTAGHTHERKQMQYSSSAGIRDQLNESGCYSSNPQVVNSLYSQKPNSRGRVPECTEYH